MKTSCVDELPVGNELLERRPGTLTQLAALRSTLGRSCCRPESGVQCSPEWSKYREYNERKLGTPRKMFHSSSTSVTNARRSGYRTQDIRAR
jgi:hypothetical protein